MFYRMRPDLSKQGHAQGFSGWGGKLRVPLAVLQLCPELEPLRLVEDEEWGQNGSPCAQLPGKLCWAALLGAEPLCEWGSEQGTEHRQGGGGCSTSTPGAVISLFLLKVSFSCQMRNTNFCVS